MLPLRESVLVSVRRNGFLQGLHTLCERTPALRWLLVPLAVALLLVMMPLACVLSGFGVVGRGMMRWLGFDFRGERM